MVNVHTDGENITIHVTPTTQSTTVQASGTSTVGAVAGSSTRYYEQLAKEHMEQAGTYANQAGTSATLAGEYSTSASASATSATQSENNAEIWAEGTDEEVQAIGGEHSSKGWVDYVMESAPTATVTKSGTTSTLVVTDIHGTTSTNIYDGEGVPGAGTTGQVLTKHSDTDYDVEWSTVDALPPQTGKEGKFLQTDGSQASWETVDLSSKQDITDNTLTTTSKTIVGAINEVNAKPSMPSLDEETITTNTNDELQAIGLVNKNPDGDTIYDWEGTLQEYQDQNVETLHPEWVCFITDDFTAQAYEAYTKDETDELLTEKSNIDADNFSVTGKGYLSGLPMPSDRYIDLTLGASDTTYTAPANGWFFLRKAQSGSGNGFINVYNNAVGSDFLYGSQVWEGTSHNTYTKGIFVPVKKGDVIRIVYTVTGSTNIFRFIYAEGDE